MFAPTVFSHTLINILDELCTENIHKLADLPVPYVEFVDNLDGVMTNPRLFKEYWYLLNNPG